MANKLKDRRLELGLTLEEVGEIVGVGKSTVRKWENGIIENMKRDKIVSLAKALKVSPIFIMEAEEDHSYSLVKKISQISERLNESRKVKVLNFAEYQLEEQNKNKTVLTYGQTAAGEPITYSDDFVEEKEVSYIPKGVDCALVIKGDSMEPNFKNGSVVFYKKQPNLENGEIGVFEIDGDGVTLKKVKYDYNNQKIILQSINNDYVDMVFENSQVKILGKVVQ